MTHLCINEIVLGMGIGARRFRARSNGTTLILRKRRHKNDVTRKARTGEKKGRNRNGYGTGQWHYWLRWQDTPSLRKTNRFLFLFQRKPYTGPRLYVCGRTLRLWRAFRIGIGSKKQAQGQGTRKQNVFWEMVTKHSEDVRETKGTKSPNDMGILSFQKSRHSSGAACVASQNTYLYRWDTHDAQESASQKRGVD